MDDATLSLVNMLLGISVLIFALAGVWLVSLGWKGKWRAFCIVTIMGLVVIGLFAWRPLMSSHDGLLTNWDMAFLLGGAALLAVELTIAAILGCVARVINLKRTKHAI